MERQGNFPATSMPDSGWWRALWPDPDGVVAALGAAAGESAIDICCGDGYFTLPLAARVCPATLDAVDLDPEELDRARRYCAEGGADNIIWTAGDVMNLTGLVSARAQFALIANTFHGVPEPTALSRQVRSVLAADGVFAVVNWYPVAKEETPVLGKPRGPATELRMSPEATAAVVEPAGFFLERTVPLPPYHYGCVFRSVAA